MILHEIFPGIFIGDQEAADACLKRSRLRSKRGITAILRCNAVVEGETLAEAPEGIAFEYVPLWDDGKDDILPHVDKAVGFMKYCLDHHGKVLVHCQAGRCRSAAVICAYLMKAWGLDFDLVEGMVHEKEEGIEVSENFRQQLRQWGSTYKFDMSLDTEEHRQYWAGRRLADSTAEGAVIEEPKQEGFDWRGALLELYRDEVGEERPEEKVNFLLSKVVNAEEPHVLYLRICRKYSLSFESRPQAVREAILALRPGRGTRRRLRCGRCSRTLCGDMNIVHGGKECTSYFIEVMEWMVDVIKSTNSGAEFVSTQTLLCTCGAKLGSWNWYGLKCSCGKFTAPAMQLHASRVDDLPIRPGEVVSLPKPYYPTE
ncbi:dual specificity protein phosphatase, putative [Perkinsus marinus ATCC 50983]|uniref:protein-tyrosine-phosphatase n=1 Tax=Perkinsus marinus (strain ATCC 50983 / TXsc) TaxID=423536 RepID=C5KWR0_PERM5|nr:dual specificity protein phosphatase, putative [Perkinsus marinus ATCC 50983]EER11135.1 dual specificity protein phosphatase, putative [Perkinsus marinus ATCC 50983]|eukprot:XP_002779340.1 dual specificity protein phosphatase, putative [Perkinsus marinus ATCC 50983]